MNNLEKRVLQLIGENPDNPDVFLDTTAGMTPIRDSINDAVQEIVMLTGGQKRKYFLPLREGQAYYRVALQDGYFGWVTDCWLVNQQRRLEQTDTTRLSANDPRWMVPAGSAVSYFPVGDELIGIYPKPSASSDALEVTYVEIPKAYATSADRVKLRVDFQDAVVHFAVSEYWATRGDANEAKAHWMKYLEWAGIRNKFHTSLQQAHKFQTEKEPWPKETQA